MYWLAGAEQERKQGYICLNMHVAFCSSAHRHITFSQDAVQLHARHSDAL